MAKDRAETGNGIRGCLLVTKATETGQHWKPDDEI